MLHAERLIVGVGLFAAFVTAAAAAQDPPSRAGGDSAPLQAIPVQSLSALPLAGASPSATATATEVTIRWTAAQPSAGAGAEPTADRFEEVGRRTVDANFVRERDPQLASDEIVIVSVAADGNPIEWQHVKDPRILRAESPGADGVLTGQIINRALTELVVALPDIAGATALRFYEPRWTGQSFTLNPLGTLPLNPR